MKPKEGFDSAGLSILHLDNHLLAIFKPSGLPTQTDSLTRPSLLILAKNWLRRKFNKQGNVFLGMVHRLDTNVSGVVLFARTSKSASRLSEQFRNREVEKFYRARVEGLMPSASGTFRHYLVKGRNQKAIIFPREAPLSKEAILEYRVLEKSGVSTLLEITLHTGRYHQIRAQMSFSKYPIVGDVKYGAKSRLDDNAIALASHRLIFHHPTKGDKLEIEAPLPTLLQIAGSAD